MKPSTKQDKRFDKGAVVIFLTDGEETILARKTRTMDIGLLNGYGGAIEGDESPEGCAVRELQDECGAIADPADLKLVGLMHIIRHKEKPKPDVGILLYVYLLDRWTGQVVSSEEMADPQWFPNDSLPLDQMVAADKLWAPRIISGEQLEGHYELSPEGEVVGQPVFEPFKFV